MDKKEKLEIMLEDICRNTYNSFLENPLQKTCIMELEINSKTMQDKLDFKSNVYIKWTRYNKKLTLKSKNVFTTGTNININYIVQDNIIKKI